MRGFMKAPMSFVQNRDDSPCSIVQTCDLDSDKKLCTGLHFLPAVFIPPILLFKGAKGPVPSRSLDRECVSFFSPKACMTSYKSTSPEFQWSVGKKELSMVFPIIHNFLGVHYL
jgi:hypothetical protein